MKKSLLAALMIPLAAAAAPNKITYQGRLTQSGVAASGLYNFSACFGPGGTPPCTGNKPITLPPSGDFTFVIDVPAGVDFLNNAVQLSILVNGNTLSPADDLVSVPYALVAGTAAVALSAQSVSASQVHLDGAGALLSSWQSATDATKIDAADILGIPPGLWTSGAAGAISYAGGNVGVGTSSPAVALDVQGGPVRAGGGLIIETRNSEPSSPATGQIWLRTDIP